MKASEPRAWLPPDALSSERVGPLIAGIVKDWSDHWFAKAEASVASFYQDDWPRRSADAGWRSCSGVASLSLTPLGEIAIVGAMLATNVPQGSIGPSDRKVIEHLAIACADDLLRRLGKLALGPNPIPPIDGSPIDLEDCTLWDISLGARKGVLKLALAGDAALQMIKRQLPKAPTTRIDPLTKGLAKQRVEVAADLGRSRLSLAELEDLAIGDVLVLDRLAAHPVPLLVEGAPSSLRASLESEGERPLLILASPGKRHV